MSVAEIQNYQKGTAELQSFIKLSQERPFKEIELLNQITSLQEGIFHATPEVVAPIKTAFDLAKEQRIIEQLTYFREDITIIAQHVLVLFASKGPGIADFIKACDAENIPEAERLLQTYPIHPDFAISLTVNNHFTLNHYFTPLGKACRKGSIAMVNWLISKGSDVNYSLRALNEYPPVISPLIAGEFSSQNLNLYKKLFQAGANPSLNMHFRHTTLAIGTFQIMNTIRHFTPPYPLELVHVILEKMDLSQHPYLLDDIILTSVDVKTDNPNLFQQSVMKCCLVALFHGFTLPRSHPLKRTVVQPTVLKYRTMTLKEAAELRQKTYAEAVQMRETRKTIASAELIDSHQIPKALIPIITDYAHESDDDLRIQVAQTLFDQNFN